MSITDRSTRKTSNIRDDTKWSIVGIVGLPANYGGFETLVENLVKYHYYNENKAELTVYCSSKAYVERNSNFLSAKLRYINLNANGVSSILYDIIALFDSALRRTDVVLVLGVSGALALPFIRLISNTRIITNVDGVEWKREKWNKVARLFLRLSEWAAVKFSHTIISDNIAIADHIRKEYNKDSVVIAYGGDHALSASSTAIPNEIIPKHFYLSLCRIEPENNVGMILESFAQNPNHHIVFVGNWEKSKYGLDLRSKYSRIDNITLLDPQYEPSKLKFIRENASGYIHGHSAGGTNPSLVEMMYFKIPIFTYDCPFNRYTTENKAIFFESKENLTNSIAGLSIESANYIGELMFEVADRKYRWDVIGSDYFQLLQNK